MMEIPRKIMNALSAEATLDEKFAQVDAWLQGGGHIDAGGWHEGVGGMTMLMGASSTDDPAVIAGSKA